MYDIKLTWECDGQYINSVSVYKSLEPLDIKDLPDPIYISDSNIKTYLDPDVTNFTKYYYLVSVTNSDSRIYFTPVLEYTPKDYSDYLLVHLPFEQDPFQDLGKAGLTWNSYYHSNKPNVYDDFDNDENPIRAAFFDHTIMRSNQALPALATDDMTIKILVKPHSKNWNSIYMWARYLCIGGNNESRSFFIVSTAYGDGGQIHVEARPNNSNEWFWNSPENMYPNESYTLLTIIRDKGIFYQYSNEILVSTNSNYLNYSIPSRILNVGGNNSGRELVRASIQDLKIYKGVAIHPIAK